MSIGYRDFIVLANSPDLLMNVTRTRWCVRLLSYYYIKLIKGTVFVWIARVAKLLGIMIHVEVAVSPPM